MFWALDGLSLVDLKALTALLVVSDSGDDVGFEFIFDSCLAFEPEKFRN